MTDIFSGGSGGSSQISEGNCFESPNLPGVLLKLHRVGEKSVSFTSNLTGDLLQQYDKAELEEELRTGITVAASCDSRSANE